MDKRTPITTPPYQVPCVDVTPDPPIFSLVTTFNRVEDEKIRHCGGLHLVINIYFMSCVCLANYGASEAVYPCVVVEKIHESF